MELYSYTVLELWCTIFSILVMKQVQHLANFLTIVSTHTNTHSLRGYCTMVEGRFSWCYKSFIRSSRSQVLESYTPSTAEQGISTFTTATRVLNWGLMQPVDGSSALCSCGYVVIPCGLWIQTTWSQWVQTMCWRPASRQHHVLTWSKAVWQQNI